MLMLRRPPQIRSVSRFPSQHRTETSTLLLVQWAFIPAFLASCCCFEGWSTVIPALFYFLMWGWGLVLPGNDSSVMVDPPQSLTRAARDRHLHCTACQDGAGLCRLSLLLQRLELACLNFIHNMFLRTNWGGFFHVINHSDFTSFWHVPVFGIGFDFV